MASQPTAPRAGGVSGAQPAQPMSTIQQVVYALQVMNTHSYAEPSLKRDANRWLEHFQTTLEAWTVADQLLQLPASSETSNIHYFGAQTLHMKILFKYSELPPGARMSLKDSILSHLKRLCTGPGHVITQLCVSLALLALQMEEWTDSIKEVIHSFTPNETTTNDQMRFGMLTCLLEFLTVLPEEAGNKRVLVLNERRTIFYRLLDTQSSNVVQLLASFFQLAGSSTSMQSKVFRCLLSWLRHSSMLTTAVGTQAASAQLSSLLGVPTPPNIRDIFLQMISFAFDALPSEELFETAVDVICEAIRQSSIDIDRTEARGTGEVEQLTLSNVAQMLLHKVLVLRDQQLNGILKDHSVAEGHELTGDEDNDMVKGLCRIFAEFGESYVEVIAQGSPEAFAVVDTLLRFTDYPESEVVSVTIWFWYRLSKVLGENAHLLSQNFTLLFQRLVAVLQRQLQYPYDYDTLGRGDQEEFRSWRRELADVLKDAAAVLGGDNCLAVLYMLLEQEYAKWKVVRTTETAALAGQTSSSSGSSTSWQSVESCLYSVRAISQFVSKQSALLAKVMDILSDLPNSRHVDYTIILLLGNYSEWMSFHPEYIETAFKAILSGFNFPALYAASTLALKSLCKSCRVHLVRHLEKLIAIYEASGKMQLPTEERGEIAAAVAYALSPLPIQNISATLQLLVMPSIGNIDRYVTSIAQDPKELGTLSKYISLELFMVFSLFKNLDIKTSLGPGEAHPAIDLIRTAWTVWEKLLNFCKSDEPIMDNLCLLFKYATRSQREQFTQFLSPIIAVMDASFREFPHSCFVYLASVFVGEYATMGPSYVPLLASMLQMFSVSTFKLLVDHSNVIAYSDVVEEYFEFSIKYIRHCPLAIAQQDPSYWKSLWECALTALSIVHSKKAIESILAFFEQLFRKVIEPNAIPELREAVQGTLSTHGTVLLKGLLISFAEHLPSCATFWLAPVLKLLLENWNEQLQHWMISTLSEISENVFSKNEKELLLRSFFSSRSKQDIGDFLEHFITLYQAKPK